MSGKCSICGMHPIDGCCECDLTHNPYPNAVEYTIYPQVPSEIHFCSSTGIWVMKLTESGIIFNRERYSDSKPDDFAQAVIDILEKNFSVKFERKNPPYDRK